MQTNSFSDNKINFKSTLKVASNLKLPEYINEFEKYLSKDGKNYIVELKADTFQYTTPQKLNDNMLFKILNKMHGQVGFKEAFLNIVPFIKCNKMRENMIESLLGSKDGRDVEVGLNAVKYHSNKSELTSKELENCLDSDDRISFVSLIGSIENFGEIKGAKRLEIINRIAKLGPYDARSYDLKTRLSIEPSLTDEERVLIIRDLIDDGGVYNSYMDAREMNICPIGRAISLLKDKNIANQMLKEIDNALRINDLQKECIKEVMVEYPEYLAKKQKQNNFDTGVTLSILDTTQNKLSEYSEKINTEGDNLISILRYMYNAATTFMK